MSVNRDALLTKLIIQRCKSIQETRVQIHEAEGFVTGTVPAKAVAFDLEHIGEAATHYSEAFLLAHPSVNWRGIKSLRNIIAHDYESLRPAEMMNITHRDIDELLKELTKEN
ncbi:MAG: hypothetical protein BWY98_00658 [Tenericutes bacterium ADurb.BinA155]|jgi:uncharacterized protein with HEPN domain|nr:MAG: hypothetical protein BWY98_00658 [Tenericutes bacterium ADurb.BinA155]